MKIEKEYNLEMLSNTLMSCISDSIDNQKYNVMIPITFAVKLSDVINMMLRKENELKKEIPECFGNYDIKSLECVMCDCEEECSNKSIDKGEVK